MDILKQIKFRCNVSSTLNRDIKQYGKMFMFDEEEDTSWSSDEGSSQWIALLLDEPQSLSSFGIQFQGGFSVKDITLVVESKKGDTLCKEIFYSEDTNSIQRFSLENPVTEKEAFKIKLLFGSSNDFFGRIIVYKLNLYTGLSD